MLKKNITLLKFYICNINFINIFPVFGLLDIYSSTRQKMEFPPRHYTIQIMKKLLKGRSRIEYGDRGIMIRTVHQLKIIKGIYIDVNNFFIFTTK